MMPSYLMIPSYSMIPELEVWTLIIQKSSVIPPSLMVLLSSIIIDYVYYNSYYSRVSSLWLLIVIIIFVMCFASQVLLFSLLIIGYHHYHHHYNYVSTFLGAIVSVSSGIIIDLHHFHHHHYHKPIFPGVERFPGRVMHAHDFRYKHLLDFDHLWQERSPWFWTSLAKETFLKSQNHDHIPKGCDRIRGETTSVDRLKLLGWRHCAAMPQVCVSL